MRIYAVKRLALFFPLLVGLSFILYSVVALAPGDPLDAIFMENPSITQEEVQRLRDYYRLDDPIPVRYWAWFRSIIFDGNWGLSRAYNVPVNRILGPRIWNTVQLTIVAVVVSVVLAIPIGVIAAVKQYSLFDYVATFFAFVGRSMPRFWFGMMAIMVFSVVLGWTPVSGMNRVGADYEGWARFLDRLRHMILPAMTLCITQVAGWSRYTRSGLLEVLHSDYIRTARAKGLSERVVLYKHALRNALLPLITLIALSLSGLVGGSVLVETIFSWPGVGRALFDALMNNDFNLALIALLLLSTITLMANLIADILYGVVDPRVTYD